MAFDNNNHMCTSFKKELLEAVHNFKVSGGSTFKISLYTNSAAGNNGFGGTSTDMDETITNYSSNNEVTGTGYVPKGIKLLIELILQLGKDREVLQQKKKQPIPLS